MGTEGGKEQTKLQAINKKEIIILRGDISEIKNRKTMETINDSKNWLFEKDKIGRLSRPTK